MNEQIIRALEEIRPALAMHAGDLEFVNFEGGVVYIRMLGMCQGCPLSQMTLKMGIEEHLRSKISSVERVEAISD